MGSEMCIRDSAEMCNTAPTTVSRVLNNPKLVAEPLRLKIQKKMKEAGFRLYGIEGEREGHWTLMDYGDLIVHIFYQPFYQAV